MVGETLHIDDRVQVRAQALSKHYIASTSLVFPDIIDYRNVERMFDGYQRQLSRPCEVAIETVPPSARDQQYDLENECPLCLPCRARILRSPWTHPANDPNNGR